MVYLLEHLSVGGGEELVLVAFGPEHGEGVGVRVGGVHLARGGGGRHLLGGDPGRGGATRGDRPGRGGARRTGAGGAGAAHPSGHGSENSGTTVYIKISLKSSTLSIVAKHTRHLVSL